MSELCALGRDYVRHQRSHLEIAEVVLKDVLISDRHHQWRKPDEVADANTSGPNVAPARRQRTYDELDVRWPSLRLPLHVAKRGHDVHLVEFALLNELLPPNGKSNVQRRARSDVHYFHLELRTRSNRGRHLNDGAHRRFSRSPLGFYLLLIPFSRQPNLLFQGSNVTEGEIATDEGGKRQESGKCDEPPVGVGAAAEERTPNPLSSAANPLEEVQHGRECSTQEEVSDGAQDERW